MNTNSNIYTIIYASVMVVIVAFVLAFVSHTLSDRQKANEDFDKMKQILTALNIDASDAEDVSAVFNKHVKADQIINSNSEVMSEEGGFSIEVKQELAKDLADRQLPLYVCDVDGEVKYILPLYGAGLWGPLWGYVALNEDKNTVYGVYFDHDGETPGLGAEISMPRFQKQFLNKELMKGDAIALSVVKNGQAHDANHEVDGLSGGTITSNGVDAMLKTCLSQYKTFLKN